MSICKNRRGLIRRNRVAAQRIRRKRPMRRILIALTAVIAVAAAILAPVDTCAQSIQRGNMRSVSGGMLQRRAKAAAKPSDEALRAAVDSLVRILPEGTLPAADTAALRHTRRLASQDAARYAAGAAASAYGRTYGGTGYGGRFAGHAAPRFAPHGHDRKRRDAIRHRSV